MKLLLGNEGAFTKHAICIFPFSDLQSQNILHVEYA